MPTHADAYSDGQLSEYSYTESYDTIDELLKRFTLDYTPEYSIKLREKRGSLIIGADVNFDHRVENSVVAVLAKPVDATKWWRRMKVTHKGDISLRSRKLHWWVFTLDLQGEINPLTKTKDISFRVATAWDVSSGRYQNKKKIQLTDGIEARVHWNVSYDLPEVSGHFSSKNDATVNDMQASLGYAHAEISKVDVSIWPRNLSIPKSRRVLLEGSQHDSDNLGDSSDGHKQWILQNFIKEFRKSK